MDDIVKLNPKGPPEYDPAADKRDELIEQGIDLPPRSPTEEAIYKKWLREQEHG